MRGPVIRTDDTTKRANSPTKHAHEPGSCGERAGAQQGHLPHAPPALASHTLALHSGQEGAGPAKRKGARPRGSSRHPPLALLNGPSKRPTSSSWLSGEAPLPCLQDPPTAAGHRRMSSATPEDTCFADETAGWFICRLTTVWT